MNLDCHSAKRVFAMTMSKKLTGQRWLRAISKR